MKSQKILISINKIIIIYNIFNNSQYKYYIIYIIDKNITRLCYNTGRYYFNCQNYTKYFNLYKSRKINN